jgi:hypothetical protein
MAASPLPLMTTFRKTREHKGPQSEADPVSKELKHISNCIARREYEPALAALDRLAARGITDPIRLSQITSLAADSQFGLARYQQAIELYMTWGQTNNYEELCKYH